MTDTVRLHCIIPIFLVNKTPSFATFYVLGIIRCKNPDLHNMNIGDRKTSASRSYHSSSVICNRYKRECYFEFATAVSYYFLSRFSRKNDHNLR